MIKNKKAQFGSVFNIITLIIFAVLVVLVFGGWIYVQHTLYNVFHQAGVMNEANYGQPGYTNMTYAADATFGVISNGINNLRMVALVFIVAIAICWIIVNSLLKIHPMFYFVYILICGLAIWFAAPVSNAYETLLNSGVYAGELANFTGANYIILNLPTFIMFVSVIGGIFLFINMIRAGNEQTLQ